MLFRGSLFKVRHRLCCVSDRNGGFVLVVYCSFHLSLLNIKY